MQDKRAAAFYRKPSLFPATFALCLLASGCAMSPMAAHTAAFSVAAGLVVDNSTSAYRAVIDLHDEEQTSEGVLKLESGKPWDVHSVKPLISPEGLKARLDVLDGLKTYAQSLSDLSSSLDSKALDTAAASVGNNLKALSTQLNTDPGVAAAGISVGTQTANGVSIAVKELGDFLIAPQIKKAVRAATKDMDPNIQVLCTLLEDDIDTIRRTTHRDYEALIVQQTEFVRDNTQQFSPTDRRAEIEKLPAILRNEQKADSALASLRKAIEALAKTHSALAAEAKGDRPEALKARIADLAAAGRNLGTFYQGLPQK